MCAYISIQQFISIMHLFRVSYNPAYVSTFGFLAAPSLLSFSKMSNHYHILIFNMHNVLENNVHRHEVHSLIRNRIT